MATDYTPKGYTDKDAIEYHIMKDIDDSYDAQLNMYIAAVEDYIDIYTGRDFATYGNSLETRRFDGDDSDELFIGSARDIDSVTFGEDGDALSPEDYVLYPENSSTVKSIKLPYYTFPEGSQNIYVSAKWGASAVPADIQLAATILVSGILNTVQNNVTSTTSDITSMTVGRYSVSYGSLANTTKAAEMVTVENILKRYKKFNF